MSNQGSLLDPPFIGHALGLKVGFMAKYELFNIPVLAQIIRACGAYPVKRGLTNKNSILTATDKLFNNEDLILLIGREYLESDDWILNGEPISEVIV